MATNAGLNIQIGANVQQLTAGLNAAANSVTNFGNSVNRLSPITAAAAAGVTNLFNSVASGNVSFSRGVSAVDNYADALRGIGRPAQDFSQTVGRLSPASGAAAAGIINLSRAINSGSASFVGYGRGAQNAASGTNAFSNAAQRSIRPTVNANGALSGFNNIIRDAPFGVIGIGNNITQLADAFSQLQRQTGSTGAALRALGGSIFGPAGLLTIGLSAAISLWTVYAQRQQQAKSKAEEASKAIKTAGQILQESAQNLSQYNAQAAAEVVTLNRLFAIAKDETRSRKERTDALKELKAQTKGYLDDLTLETVQTGKAREALDKYNASLFNSAVIKAYQGQVEELAKSYAATKARADEGRKAIDEFDAALRRQRERIARGEVAPSDIAKSQEQVVGNEVKRNALVKSTNDEIKKQNALYDQILSVGGQIANLQAQVNPFTAASNKSGKDIRTVQDVLNELRTDLVKLETQFAATGGSLEDLTKDKISAFKNAIGQLSDLGIRPGSELFASLTDEIKRYQDVLTRTPVKIKIPVNIDPIPSALNSNTIAQINKVAADTSYSFSRAFEKELTQLNASVNSTLQSTILDSMTAFADGIGSVLAGKGGFQDAFKSFANIFGSYLQSLGKSLIAYSGILKGIMVAISSLNPAVAAAAGAAALIAGGAIKAYASKVPSFATGGVVTEPTLAMVGDNPGRKEAIIPSELWDKIGSGGGYIATAELDYDKLRLRLDQDRRRAGY